MPSPGEYSEKLPCGGLLKVSSNGWHIHYYFPGPDLRYNGTLVDVLGHEVASYIEAFRDNWAEREKLKAQMPKGGEFQKEGKAGMTIRVGGLADGVCLRSYHMPISSERQLAVVIGAYEYAQTRATAVQSMLKEL